MFAPTSINEDSCSPPRKRQRARRACLPCRQRKRKCNAEFPCSMCTTYRYQCQFAPDDSPSGVYAEDSHISTTAASTGTSASNLSSSANTPTPIRTPKLAPVDPESNDISTTSPQQAPDNGILDAAKSRYMGTHSLMAFPRALGLDFRSSNPPRVHSFGWNCGIRPLEEGGVYGDLRDMISREEVETLIGVYLETADAVFGLFKKEMFEEKMEKWWVGVDEGSRRVGRPFEAVLAGVVGLGSFFSPSPGHPREAQITKHAKDILEDDTLHPTIEHVLAWILRTLYLRSTTRPHRAWIASCTTIHLAEATGLHHEIDSVTLMGPTAHLPAYKSTNCEQARRIFWSAWAINAMISYEYGRSPVVLSGISCKLPQPAVGTAITNLIAIAQLVPQSLPSERTAGPDLPSTLAKLQAIPVSHPFIAMSKADLCMSLYRHARLHKQPLAKRDVLAIIALGNAAVAAASSLAAARTYWWSVLCSVFQYVCVALAIDTAESLASVAGSMAALERIAADLGTHVAREAVSTAKVLLRDSVRKKRVEVEMLELADRGVDDWEGGAEGGLAGRVEANGEIGGGYEGVEGVSRPVEEMRDIDWDTLLDPWYMSVFATQDFDMMGMEGTGGVVPTL